MVSNTHNKHQSNESSLLSNSYQFTNFLFFHYYNWLSNFYEPWLVTALQILEERISVPVVIDRADDKMINLRFVEPNSLCNPVWLSVISGYFFKKSFPTIFFSLLNLYAKFKLWVNWNAHFKNSCLVRGIGRLSRSFTKFYNCCK